MPNKWITHVKKYHSDHPNLNYKQAMQQAKKTYNKIQKGKGGGASKPSATLNPMTQEPTLEQLQTESRQWARHHNNHIEAMGDRIQNKIPSRFNSSCISLISVLLPHPARPLITIGFFESMI